MLKIKDFEKKLLEVKPNKLYFYNTEIEDIEEVKEEIKDCLEKYPVVKQRDCFMQIKAHMVDLNAMGMDLIKDFVKKNPNKELESNLDKNDASYIFNLINKDISLSSKLSKMMHANDFDKLYSLAKRYEIALNPSFEFKKLVRENRSLKLIATNIRHIAETSNVCNSYLRSSEATFKLQKRLYNAGYYFESYYIGLINEPDHASLASYADVAPGYVEAAYYMMENKKAIDPENRICLMDSFIEISFNDAALKERILAMFGGVMAKIEELPEWHLGFQYGYKVYQRPFPNAKNIQIGVVLNKTRDKIKALTTELDRSIRVTIVDVLRISPYVEPMADTMAPQAMKGYADMGVFYRREVKVVNK